jgi:tRNA nucleotidyltransferase (CCA-adding enzyme)
MSLSGKDFGTIVDATGGLRDLESGVIRMTYPDSFIEDPARILRAISIQMRLGFALDEETRQKAREALELGLLNLRRNKRAQDEFKEMLAGVGSSGRMRALCTLGCRLLGLPLTSPGPSTYRLLSALESANPPQSDFPEAPDWVAPLLVWLGHTPAHELQPILKDFGLNDRLSAACSSWRTRESAVRRDLSQASAQPSDIAAKLARLPTPVVLILQARLAVAASTEAQKLLARVLSSMAEPPLISGADLAALGVRQGREVGKLLERVRNLQLNGVLQSREAALAYLRTLKG